MLRRRWPEVAVAEVGALEPSWSMSVEDTTELARVRRGVEPLRIVVLPQRHDDPLLGGHTAVVEPPVWLEPMPVVL